MGALLRFRIPKGQDIVDSSKAKAAISILAAGGDRTFMRPNGFCIRGHNVDWVLLDLKILRDWWESDLQLFCLRCSRLEVLT